MDYVKKSSDPQDLTFAGSRTGADVEYQSTDIEHITRQALRTRAGVIFALAIGCGSLASFFALDGFWFGSAIFAAVAAVFVAGAIRTLVMGRSDGVQRHPVEG